MTPRQRERLRPWCRAVLAALALLLAALALAVALSGCARTPAKTPYYVTTEQPGQAEALRLVWREIFRRDEPPPIVQWVTGPALDCEDGRGFRADGWRCIPGQTMSDTWIVVALPGGARLAETALVHELGHVYVHALTGNWDWPHADPAWGTDGAITTGERALAAAGL